mmetsp:Transcript_45239/g.144150  ORF Transcript_45239/g.144150 Transcript_45239/m.144150 type:complete len:284 (+) Transcript_45239:567-1418(+)
MVADPDASFIAAVGCMLRLHHRQERWHLHDIVESRQAEQRHDTVLVPRQRGRATGHAHEVLEHGPVHGREEARAPLLAAHLEEGRGRRWCRRRNRGCCGRLPGHRRPLHPRRIRRRVTPVQVEGAAGVVRPRLDHGRVGGAARIDVEISGAPPPPLAWAPGRRRLPGRQPIGVDTVAEAHAAIQVQAQEPIHRKERPDGPLVLSLRCPARRRGGHLVSIADEEPQLREACHAVMEEVREHVPRLPDALGHAPDARPVGATAGHGGVQLRVGRSRALRGVGLGL